MGKALYRKHRPKKLADVVGQEHITTTLENALKKDGVSHAYLFTGPRGVGKTSIARILAHEVNKLSYDEDATHLDIIEIDAASNRRIDEIRTLRERVHNAPAVARYKVYIIDEVHMLTREAFNALLKTLEEPPAHAIFILATTEAHKLPETIVSRTQRFTFKPVERSKAVEHLRHIANEEQIDISDDALELIAEHGGGSFRDSISLLDQLGGGGAVIDLAAAQRALGIAPSEAIAELVEALSSGNTSNILNLLQGLQEQGYQAPQIAKQLSAHLRTGILEDKSKLDSTTTSSLMQRLIDVSASHDPNALLEIILLEVALSKKPPVGKIVDEKVVTSPGVSEEPKKKPKPTKEEKTAETNQKKREERREKPTVSSLDETAWQNVLHALKQKYNTLYGIARMATPLFRNGDLTLVFAFPFHQKRLDDSKNKQILSEIIKEQTGKSVSITCIVDKKQASPPENPPQSKDQPDKDPLTTISNIFGDAEVLE